jgi:hypothetical protein
LSQVRFERRLIEGAPTRLVDDDLVRSHLLGPSVEKNARVKRKTAADVPEIARG